MYLYDGHKSEHKECIELGFAVRRKNRRGGKSSNFLNIPKPVKSGRESTIAVALDHLILADPLGEIPEQDLLKFMESYVEPAFMEWRRKNSRSEAVTLSAPGSPKTTDRKQPGGV